MADGWQPLRARSSHGLREKYAQARDTQKQEFDIDRAEHRAGWAEDDALAAIDFAYLRSRTPSAPFSTLCSHAPRRTSWRRFTPDVVGGVRAGVAQRSGAPPGVCASVLWSVREVPTRVAVAAPSAAARWQRLPTPFAWIGIPTDAR